MAKGKKPGSPKTGGRQPGSPNQNTKAVKDALWSAFNGIGGLRTFQLWALENQTEFYKLWSRMMPTELTGEGGGPLKIEVMVNLVGSQDPS